MTKPNLFIVPLDLVLQDLNFPEFDIEKHVLFIELFVSENLSLGELFEPRPNENFALNPFTRTLYFNLPTGWTYNIRVVAREGHESVDKCLCFFTTHNGILRLAPAITDNGDVKPKVYMHNSWIVPTLLNDIDISSWNLGTPTTI